ncbi:hypothetical protein PROFUN_13263, partial [Planoprotostelium fungivorum]
RANAYKCFAEDYQTEHRRQAFSARRRHLLTARSEHVPSAVYWDLETSNDLK